MLNAFKSRAVIIAAGIVCALLVATQVWVHSSGPPQSQPVLVREQPPGTPLQLRVTFSGDVLVGTVATSNGGGQPEMDLRGQAYLLGSSGQQLASVPLQPLAPGEFRLIAPLDRMGASGYLDVRLSGEGSSEERRAIYQLDRDQRTVTWTETGTEPVSPLSVQASGDPDEFGYTWDDAIAYNWVDTSSGTSVTLRDDDWMGPYDIGFTFDFYGQDYKQFYVDSNGYIGFDDEQTASYFSNTQLPDVSRPNNLIAPFWDDFDPSTGGTVRFQTFGSSPNRYLVVEWNEVPLYYSSSDAQTFQVILYEGSNDIKFQYPDTREGEYGDRQSGTVGIENRDGTIGLEHRYLIPITQTYAIQFDYNRPAYNVFMTPEHQGSPAAKGEEGSFSLMVENLGSSSEAFTLSRPTYEGADWSVSFYAADGSTPLSGDSTGTIGAGGEKEIVAKVQVPSGASAGDWTRATIRAVSQSDPSEYHGVTLDAMLSTSFAQVYTDNESGDDTEDSENYFDPLQEGQRHTRRVTTDQDDSEYAGVATTPNNNAVNVWNTFYYNGSTWVTEIQYAILSPSGGFVLPVTRLTNNSAITSTTYDFSPAVDVAPNGNIAIGWARQPGTYNVWYAIADGSGNEIESPTALTNNTSDYPRDYPPSVAALTGGRFLLAWEHWENAPESGGPGDVYYAVLNNDGSIAETATRLTDGTGFNVTPRVASLPSGEVAIVWTSYNVDGYPEISYATVDGSGVVTGGPAQITSNGDSGAGSRYADVVALSDGRLAVAWTQGSTDDEQNIQYTIISDLQSTPTPTPSTPTPTPTTTPTPPASEGIHGQVTYQGSPIAGINLALRFYDGSEWTTAYTTTTQADGTYQFTEVASLSSDQKYYVRYQNGDYGNSSNSDYLFSWSSFDIISYTAGESVAGGDFDIANISLISPDPGATVSLPHTFQWTRRAATTSDSYEFNLFDPGDLDPWMWTDPPLGYVESYTLESLPSGFSTGTEYGWNIWVYGPEGGTGISYYYRRVTFSSGVSKPQGESVQGCQSSELQFNRLVEARKEPPSSSRPVNISIPNPPHLAQKASIDQTIYTVPNDLSDDNVNVSLTTDGDDNLIMTWLDGARNQYLFYALADSSGSVQTPATIFQRTRNSYLWSSWNGYGNDVLAPAVGPAGPHLVYLPVVIRNYPPPPPPPPVTNGGFEEGDFNSWTIGGDEPGLLPQVVSSRRKSGNYAAVLGQEGAPCESGEGGLVGQSWIYQDITVPDSGSPTLTLYFRIFTYDKLIASDPDRMTDRFEVYINGTLLERFGDEKDYGCPDVSDLGWQQFTYNNFDAYRGRTIRLKLVNITHPDDWFGTWTYVDDVEID